METVDISYMNLLYLLVLLVPIGMMNIKLDLSINKELITSIIRMFIQLTLVGVYLQYLFKWNNPYVNILYLIIMVLVSSNSIIKRCKFKFKRLLIPILSAQIIPVFAIVTYFNYFVVELDQLFEAKYIITIGGMLLGNCLGGTIIGLNSFYKAIRENEKEYLYTLSLGASRNQALLPYYKEALLASINPFIASMATIGLVSLPGMMTGQILGGSLPFDAIKYQIAIMLAIFIVKYFSLVLALKLTMKSAFDGYDCLIRDIFIENSN